jgi:hypothetical protein
VGSMRLSGDDMMLAGYKRHPWRSCTGPSP